MIKPYWAFIIFLALIPLNTERAFAQLFSSKIDGITNSWNPSPTDAIEVAQAPPASNAVIESSISLPDFENRFAKDQYAFGFNLGIGFTVNIPPVDAVSDERTQIRFVHFFPNFKYNLTGPMGKSIYKGALYWVIEAGAAVSFKDPERNNLVVDNAPTFMLGLVPMQLEYKFLNFGRSWAPFLFFGLGGAWGDWFQESKEIATAFEFILQAGGGIEYFFDNGTAINFNYRLWHLSNSNVQSPNIGLNAHVFSMGYSF
jgi:hypothetical protein